MAATRYWCGVVSKDHILRGVEGGFCQMCHGKERPLARMNVGDGIVFYSPSNVMRGKEKLQKFTAIGRVVGKDIYQFEMAPDFVPFRRDIDFYHHTQDVSIQDLLSKLSFTKDNKKSWGAILRFGHFEITAADYALIAKQMLPHFDACNDLENENKTHLEGEQEQEEKEGETTTAASIHEVTFVPGRKKKSNT